MVGLEPGNPNPFFPVIFRLKRNENNNAVTMRFTRKVCKSTTNHNQIVTRTNSQAISVSIRIKIKNPRKDVLDMRLSMIHSE